MQTCHQVFSKSSYHYALGSAQTGSLSIGKTNMFSVFLCMVTTGLMLVSPVPTCYLCTLYQETLQEATQTILSQIDQWMADSDLNKDGVVSYEEFKKSLQKAISSYFSTC